MNFIYPQWPAPKYVKACTTCASTSAHTQNFSLGLHSSQDPGQIQKNRSDLQHRLALPQAPWWLDQYHSNLCHLVPDNQNRAADASITTEPGLALGILTADCLPILICHQTKPEIGAIHAGWRGLFQGIIENTVKKLVDRPHHYLVWLGPAICQQCYAVDQLFKDNFLQQYPAAEDCFKFNQQWHFSLAEMATKILQGMGIEQIYPSNICTYEDPKLYSYRRDAGQTGRIASLIWMEACQ